MFKTGMVAAAMLLGATTASAQQPPTNTIGHHFAVVCGMLSGRAWCGRWAPASLLGYIQEMAPIPGDPGVVSIAVTGTSACGLTAGGELYCAGMNEQRRFAPFTAESPVTACGMESGLRCSDHLVRVAAPLTFSSFGVGGQTMCAITRTAKLWCWGNNQYGQLGIPQNRGTDRPVAILPAMNFSMVVNPDDHTCALTTAGAAWCWGFNLEGELGVGFSDSGALGRRPTPVAGNHLFTTLSSSSRTACGLTADGALYCWGKNLDDYFDEHHPERCNTPGRPTCFFVVPTAVAPAYRFRSISVAENHVCGMTTAGEAVCWGSNGSGRLGVGRAYEALSGSREPLVVAAIRLVAVAAGSLQSCGVTAQDAVYCWGQTHYEVDWQQTTPELIPPAVLGDEARAIFARWPPNAAPAPGTPPRPAAAPSTVGKRRAPPSGLPHPSRP